MQNSDGSDGYGAGNGLFDRRRFLGSGLAIGGSLLCAQAAGKERQPWMMGPGAALSESGSPSVHAGYIKRIAVGSQPGSTGTGVSRTPLEYLDGIITPSRLHFERHHSGIPDIDPQQHRIYLSGLVRRPLSFTAEALQRYPMVSRIQFLECSGNSGAMIAAQALDASCGELHGLVSASEWGGVPLSILLEEAGITKDAAWIVADGADAAMMSRSVPLAKVMDDAIVALYQNGEPLRPSNGYPMRLFLPGWEGNMCVKWLRSVRVTAKPAMTKDETSRYSDLQDNGRARLFTYPMGVKSLITSPSPGLTLGPKGVYQLKGVAWSGSGRIRRVEVSADGGKSWADAALDENVLPKSLTRFRTAWHWDGGPAVIMSRATDDSGEIQPTRAKVLEGRASNAAYHYNGIQAWAISNEGKVRNVYA